MIEDGFFSGNPVCHPRSQDFSPRGCPSPGGVPTRADEQRTLPTFSREKRPRRSADD